MRFLPAAPLVVAFSMLIASCSSDGVSRSELVAPSTHAPVSALRLLDSPAHLSPLQRTAPLATALTGSATIGALGGRLAIPAAGLTVVVPPLALASPTTISVTALAGSDVAYEFAPHGLTFQLPLVATQSLDDTDAGLAGSIDPRQLIVGYFSDATRVDLVTELLSPTLDALAQRSTVLLFHFSGYMWSSGREDDTGGDSTSATGTRIRRTPRSRGFAPTVGAR